VTIDHKVLDEAVEVAAQHLAGALATLHAEHATPQVSFVFFHLEPDGRLLFGSNKAAQHSQNLLANPACSFLIDNRQAIPDRYDEFDRINIEGAATCVEPGDDRYAALLESLRTKNPLAARFTESGHLFCIEPRRLVLYRGARSQARVLNFPANSH